MSGLEKNRDTYRAAVTALTDPGTTRLVLVARAQDSTLREVARTREELAKLGIPADHLASTPYFPQKAEAIRCIMPSTSVSRPL